MSFFRPIAKGATGVYVAALSNGEWLSLPDRYADAKIVALEYSNRTGRYAKPVRVGWFYRSDGPYWLYHAYL